MRRAGVPSRDILLGAFSRVTSTQLHHVVALVTVDGLSNFRHPDIFGNLGTEGEVLVVHLEGE